MAVSLLEQRIESLEVRVPLGFGIGPCGLPPSMELLAEEYGDDGTALAFRNLRRNRTWAGYAGRLLRRDYGLAEAENAEASESETESEQEDRFAAGRAQGGCCGQDVRLGDALADRLAPSEGDSASTCCSFSRRGSFGSLSQLEEEEAAGLSRRSSLSAASSLATTISLERCLRPLSAAPAAAPLEAPRRGRRGAGSKRRPVTTIMVQNLARNMTRQRFLDTLQSLGFEGRYDYLHVPTSFQNGRNQGFAFVNFLSEDVARDFSGRFLPADGNKPEDGLWRVAPAAVQGFKANAEAANKGKLARVRSAAHRPLILPLGLPAPEAP